jgi:hypothetical protein
MKVKRDMAEDVVGPRPPQEQSIDGEIAWPVLRAMMYTMAFQLKERLKDDTYLSFLNEQRQQLFYPVHLWSQALLLSTTCYLI